MPTIQRFVTLGILVVSSMSADALDAVAQHAAMTISPGKAVLPTVVYYRHDWVVDMRQGDGDLRRHTCLSGVFARDGAYYPFQDHIDEGSLQHVNRSYSDGRSGYYHQRGFIWLSHGNYRESAGWTHYRRVDTSSREQERSNMPLRSITTSSQGRARR